MLSNPPGLRSGYREFVSPGPQELPRYGSPLPSFAPMPTSTQETVRSSPRDQGDTDDDIGTDDDDDSQPDFSPEELDDTAPPPVLPDQEGTVEPVQSTVIPQEPDLTSAPSEIVPEVYNGLEPFDEEDKPNMTTPPVQLDEEEKAELVMEPIPTPMALISSNGEGSNPPLEEEFAEAFKKFGPNGRRRRIRPGGGGKRRVRMRVKKLNRAPSSSREIINLESPTIYEDPVVLEEQQQQPTRRPRRYRSTTPNTPQDQEDVSPTMPEPTATTTVIKNGPKPIIISDVHSGSTGLTAVSSSQIPQLERPGLGGGFTEQISTYFFTPPPRISTTEEPKLQNNNNSDGGFEGLKMTSASIENQLHSSSSFALQNHPWDTAADKKDKDGINDKPDKQERIRIRGGHKDSVTIVTPVPTKNEPEKSESVVRKMVHTPMEDRNYNVHSGQQQQDGMMMMDFDGGNRNFAHHDDEGQRNSFGFTGMVGNPSGENTGFFSPNSAGSEASAAAAPFSNFESNPPFPPRGRGSGGGGDRDHHPRSHYDRTKDPFFTSNPFFKSGNPFSSPPSSASGETHQVKGAYEHHSMEGSPTGPESDASQMQLPLFDKNGAYMSLSTMSPMAAEQFYAPPHDDLQGDYGTSTHYAPVEFKSSPADPRDKNNNLRGRETFTQRQRPGFPTEPDYNYDPGKGNLPNPQAQHGYPPPEFSPNGDGDVNPGSNPNYPDDLSENMIHSEHDVQSEYGSKNPTALSLSQATAPTEHQKEFANHNYLGTQDLAPQEDGQMSNYSEYNEIISHHHSLPPNNGQEEMAAQMYALPPNQGGSGDGTGFQQQAYNTDNNRPLHPHHNHRPPPPHFFRNSVPPMMHHHPHHHPRFSHQRLPMPNTPLYSVAPSPFGGGGGDGIGQPPPDFSMSSSPHVNMPMPGLNNIPPPPSEQEALSQVQPNHHFPPHTHSMSDRPDYEPANPPLPPGHPMEINYPPPSFGGEVMSNHIDDTPPGQGGYHQPHFDDHLNPSGGNHNHQNHNYNGGGGDRPNGNNAPGYDILSAYYDKPPPTVGSPDYDRPSTNNNDNLLSKVPFQYSSSDGGGLDNNNVPFTGKQKDTEPPSDTTKEKSPEDKNLTAMYSETPYVLMFPQLVPEAAMIPPPPKILTKEIPVVQASSLSTMHFTPEGKPVLPPGMKAVAVHPRHQMYQVLAKAHYDKALQQYMEARKKPPSAIYTPYGILVPMGPSASASTNHEKYAKLESHQARHGKTEKQNHAKDPHERTLLHLLLGKKSPLGHFHLLKSASIKNGRLKQHFDIKANIDPALDLLAEKLALKLSAAKYLLTAPAKFGVHAFSKPKQHTASYSEHSPQVVESPSLGGGQTSAYANSISLGSELKDILAASQSAYDQQQKQVKGEVVDPELKNELKNMLKDRLREILEETDNTMEMEKEHLASLASNLVHTTKAHPAAGNPKWSAYFPPTPPSGGLIGTIKRLFFGNPSSSGTTTLLSGNERSDTILDNPVRNVGAHPFGSGSSLNFLNSVGRMGMSEASSLRTKALLDPFGPPYETSSGSEKKVKKQLEKWLDMVLKSSPSTSSSSSSDMATSESKQHPVWVSSPPPSPTSWGKNDSIFSHFIKPDTPVKKSSLASLSLAAAANSLGLPGSFSTGQKSSSTTSNFLASNWTPMVSSAFRSVFNYSPLKSNNPQQQQQKTTTTSFMKTTSTT